MGAALHSTHAGELLDVGATLVAVGTESFREPAARDEAALSEESRR
jgi:hypothetical protein